MHVVSGLHMASPTSIVYTGNGITAVVGFITDVNDDHLLDFVVAYYQRDYNFASQVIYLNNGCGYVRHSNPFEPLVYCKQHFLNQIMIKWEADPPVITLHIPNDTFSGDEIYVGQPGPPSKPSSPTSMMNGDDEEEDQRNGNGSSTTLPYSGTGTGASHFYYGSSGQPSSDVVSSSGQVTGGQHQPGVIPAPHGKNG
ncbi:hypothetical protein FDP41_012497 [Naegleria fowleri]|uniref:Uncharacterized protein n=1 Tax=Naegleria fowleri TaxID=5763 RepID=A0A6A5BVX6_NAEFO|nr:uncharacterized protein FDP41_012497 [Naegleria fowleri]KAF0981387.1 hypothetical protein FDP41_012497 [Naegleria fowleri]